jgi:hypothetical protein
MNPTNILLTSFLLSRSSGYEKCLPCPLGHYCGAENTVVPIQCDAGKYGHVEGLKTKECSDVCFVPEVGKAITCQESKCEEGYYCPMGSISSRQVKCGDESVYCPLASKVPTAVSTGYYTVGASPSTRHAQKICEPGFYCVKGIKYECMEGLFGATYGLSTIDCSGVVPKGFFSKGMAIPLPLLFLYACIIANLSLLCCINTLSWSYRRHSLRWSNCVLPPR